MRGVLIETKPGKRLENLPHAHYYTIRLGSVSQTQLTQVSEALACVNL